MKPKKRGKMTMTAILKRELKEYFYTPIGYVFVGFFMFLTSWIFSYTNIFSASGDLSSLFGNLTIVFMFLVPVLTMRLISEEKNTKTDQLLLTAPIGISKIVLGKVFSAFCVFLITLVLSLVYPIIVSIYSKPPVISAFSLWEFPISQSAFSYRRSPKIK